MWYVEYYGKLAFEFDHAVHKVFRSEQKALKFYNFCTSKGLDVILYYWED